MQFNNVNVIDRVSAEMAFASSNEEHICQSLVSLAFHESDWLWVQNWCLDFLESDNPNIAEVSATCLGHLARIHRKLEKDKVMAALQVKRNDSEIAGVVEDAIDDISRFIL